MIVFSKFLADKIVFLLKVFLSKKECAIPQLSIVLNLCHLEEVKLALDLQYKAAIKFENLFTTRENISKIDTKNTP